MDSALLTGKRVLVIEDEMLVVMGLEDMLSDLGCTSVTIAGNIDAALVLIAANTFDVATLDLNLNGTLSYEIAESLDEHHVPFAFSTGYGKQGVNGYGERKVLNKPFNLHQFEQVIRELLADGSPPPALAA